MPVTRLGVMLLPQAGVAYAYQNFHQTVASTLMSGTELFALGASLYTLLVVVFGLLTLGGNILIATALLNVATKLGPTRDSRRFKGRNQSAGLWIPGSDPVRNLRPEPNPYHAARQVTPTAVTPKKS